MHELLNRLKIRLEIDGSESDELLKDIILSSQELFLSLRYPTTAIPVDENDEPVIERRWNDWLLRCAIEIYSKLGMEGQTSHVENSFQRSYDSGSISESLRSEITPIVGIAR